MIVEGEEGKGLVKLALPDGAEVMKIARAEERKRMEHPHVCVGKVIDPFFRSDKAQSFRLLSHIHDRQVESIALGDEIPCVVGSKEDLI